MDSIIKDFIAALSGIQDVQVFDSQDFSTKRTSNIIIVGIDNIEQMNFGLPDYKYDVTISVDTFIDSDLSGETFKRTCNEVRNTLSGLTEEIHPNFDLFFLNSHNVVGFLTGPSQFTLLDASHHATFKYQIITSD